MSIFIDIHCENGKRGMITGSLWLGGILDESEMGAKEVEGADAFVGHVLFMWHKMLALNRCTICFSSWFSSSVSHQHAAPVSRAI